MVRQLNDCNGACGVVGERAQEQEVVGGVCAAAHGFSETEQAHQTALDHQGHQEARVARREVCGSWQWEIAAVVSERQRVLLEIVNERIIGRDSR